MDSQDSNTPLLQFLTESHGLSRRRPLHSFLSQHPNIAWEVARHSNFYSNASIPELLHTCRDSRQELVRRGYRLAFGTWSAGPRIWFHFERDVLFLPQTPRPPYSRLPLHPVDLKRVKRVAVSNQPLNRINRIVRLMEHLGQLLLVPSTLEFMETNLEVVFTNLQIRDLIPVKIQVTEYPPWNLDLGESVQFDPSKKLSDFVNSRRAQDLNSSVHAWPDYYTHCWRETKRELSADYKEHWTVDDKWGPVNLHIVHMLPRLMLDSLHERRRSKAVGESIRYDCMERCEVRENAIINIIIMQSLYEGLATQHRLVDSVL